MKFKKRSLLRLIERGTDISATKRPDSTGSQDFSKTAIHTQEVREEPTLPREFVEVIVSITLVC